MIARGLLAICFPLSVRHLQAKYLCNCNAPASVRYLDGHHVGHGVFACARGCEQRLRTVNVAFEPPGVAAVEALDLLNQPTSPLRACSVDHGDERLLAASQQKCPCLSGCELFALAL